MAADPAPEAGTCHGVGLAMLDAVTSCRPTVAADRTAAANAGDTRLPLFSPVARLRADSLLGRRQVAALAVRPFAVAAAPIRTTSGAAQSYRQFLRLADPAANTVSAVAC